MTNSHPDAGPHGSIARKIVALAVGTALAVALLLAWFAYRAETGAALLGVDAKLRALAASADALVPDDVHGRIARGDLDIPAYEALAARLTTVADEAEVTYLYTCIVDGDDIFVETTSRSVAERTAGEAPQLRKRYERPPSELRASFADGVTRFADYSDEYGSFRSIFRPVPTRSGTVVVGADVRLDELRAIAVRNLAWQSAITLLVTLPAALAAIFLGRRIARPIVQLAQSVRAFATDEFADDDESLQRFERVAMQQRDETRTLAVAILDLRRRLVRHLAELTRVTAEKEQMSAKLAIARDIQRGLLPTSLPEAPGFDIAGWSEAADETGGDFYDWMVTPRGEVVFVLADVTGHGIGPSLMAAVCRAYARATLVEDAPIEPLLARLNRLVHTDTQNGQFVTLFAGVLVPSSRQITILSAGHGPILLYRAREHRVVETPTHGLPLGVLDDLGADPGTQLTLEPGDILMIVSDGFFEWASAGGEQFGPDRLAESLLESSQHPSAEIIERLKAAVYRHTAGTAQPDDMTALLVRCLPV
ncbi:MAG: PP2C family protein-serine/threonine phosphatase [Phycisphaerae bacterium]|nr:PP2C family protein-serine/threonine phosphatase [Phycisphaerae bacterium]